MSKYRRKLLQSYYWRWKEIARFDTVETDATYTLSLDGYATIGLFIVGGGGGGKGDRYSARFSGNGGNGGQVMHYQTPVVVGQNTFTITIGDGGKRCEPNDEQQSSNGQPSSVIYNGMTYLAEGGNGGRNYSGYDSGPNIFQENSGAGGVAYNLLNRYTHIDFSLSHSGREYYIETNGIACYGGLGENGQRNSFDLTDMNMYGAGGAAGWNTYGNGEGYPRQYSPLKGGITGGGGGGYGNPNAPENTGADATFYGGGGGGGAFSETHKYSYGGAGYHGLVIIYGSVI